MLPTSKHSSSVVELLLSITFSVDQVRRSNLIRQILVDLFLSFFFLTDCHIVCHVASSSAQ